MLAMKPVQLITLPILLAAALFTTIARAADPLPSWNDGEAKKAIVEFVEKVTTEGGPDFVPVAQRIATFDNDGTLWAEQPMYFQLRQGAHGNRRRYPRGHDDRGV
jgi:hypothetical protein